MADGKQFKLDPNYNDVASRLGDLREKHPEASCQPADPARPFWFEKPDDDHVYLVYVAACYRTPDDPRPGIGMAWEPFPGTTPYTRNSELMVAETSAWGRAIVAALAADTKKGIASSDEIAARQGEPQAPAEARVKSIDLIATLDDANKAKVKAWFAEHKVPSLTKMGATLTQLNELADYIETLTEPFGTWVREPEGDASGSTHPSEPEPIPFAPVVAKPHTTATERAHRDQVEADIREGR